MKPVVDNHAVKVVDAASNKRIDYLYSLLNELRSGCVTYTDIVRRERFHPPVRKILLKLGVQRATDIKNDDQLRKVITDIVMKKGNITEESKASNQSSKDTQDNEIVVPGNAVPVAKIQDKKADSESLKNESRTVSSSKDRNLRKPDEYEVFRRLILAVHSQNGRVRAALSMVRPSPQVSLERLIAVVNAVCAIAGTTRLVKTLPEVEVSTAFNTYWYGTSIASEVQVSPRTVEIRKEAVSSPVENNNASEFDEADDVASLGEEEDDEYDQGDYSIEGREGGGGGGEEDFTDDPFALEIQPPTDFVEDWGSRHGSFDYDAPASPHDKSSHRFVYIDSPEKPSSLNDSQYKRSTFLDDDERDPRYLDDRTPRIRLDSGESTSSSPLRSAFQIDESIQDIRSWVHPMDVSLDYNSIYVNFWEKVFAMFYFVSNPSEPIKSCLLKIEDVSTLLDSVPEFVSPVIVIALDVIVQRAMYELSDKVVRCARTSDEKETISNAQDIDQCVSLMATLVLPLAEGLLKKFPLSDIPSIPIARFTEKVQTLSRQLQELIAWTSFHGQQTVRQTFPFPIPSSNSNSGTPISHREAARARSSSAQIGLTESPSQAPPGLLSSRASTTEIVDDNLKLFLKEVTPPGYLMTEVEKMRVKLHKLLNRQVSAEMTISLCGSAALGLADSELKLEADFVALIPPYSNNFYNLTSFYNKKETEKIRMLRDEYKDIEKAIEKDILAEYAYRHLKAASKDVRNIAAEFLAHIKSSLVNYDPQRASADTILNLMRAFAFDLDTIVYAADEVLKKYSAIKQEKLRDPQGLPMMMKKLEVIQDMFDKSENEKNQLTRRIIKIVEKNLKDQGCVNIRSILSKGRFLQLKFSSQEAAKEPLHFSLTFNSTVPSQATELLSTYASLDRTGKIHDFFFIVKVFAKCHHINDSSAGFLSSFAWVVLALHVLLRYEFLPNIHGDVISRDDEYLDESDTKSDAATDTAPNWSLENGIFKDFVMNPKQLEQRYVSKIESTSLLEMLDIFFRYYVEVFDPFESVVSLKGRGEVMRKSVWRKNAALWRLSIEDPFEHVNSIRPYDLGSTLSRPGQLTTYKALRRAIFGIHSIIIMGPDMCRINIKKFFSKNDLIHLARKADYLGTIMNETKLWRRQRRSGDSSHESSSDVNRFLDASIDFDLLHLREYLPRKMISMFAKNEYMYDGAICVNENFDPSDEKGFASSDRGIATAMADSAMRGGNSNMRATPMLQSNAPSFASQSQQQFHSQSPAVTQTRAPTNHELLLQSKSELDYHRKVNSSQPFRSQYHYQPPPNPAAAAAAAANAAPSQPPPFRQQPPPPQHMQRPPHHSRYNNNAPPYRQQPPYPSRDSNYNNNYNSPNYNYNQRRPYAQQPPPPQQQQPYHQHQPPPPPQQQQPPPHAYPLQRFDLSKGGYQQRSNDAQQFGGDKRNRPALNFPPRIGFDQGYQGNSMLERDAPLGQPAYPSGSRVSVSSNIPPQAAPLSRRSEPASVKVLKDPRFKFVASKPDEPVGFDYDRLLASRVTIDSNASLLSGVSSRSNSARQASPLYSGRDLYSQQSDSTPSSAREEFSSNLLDDNYGVHDASLLDASSITSNEQYLQRKAPYYQPFGDRGGTTSAVPLTAKAKPFVPSIPLSGLNKNSYFETEDSDINTTGRSNYSKDNEALSLDNDFGLPLKAPSKKSHLVPPISLSALHRQQQFEYDEPLKSDRFLDLSSMQPELGTGFGKPNDLNFGMNDRRASIDKGRSREHPLEKGRPWHPPLNEGGSGNSNSWMGERVSAYADEILTGTPRQSVTTHESSSYLTFQGDSPHATSPRMPISAPPGITGNAANSALHSFLSDYSSIGLGGGPASAVAAGTSSLFGDHSSSSFFSHNSTSQLPPSYPSGRDLILDDSLGNQSNNNSTSSSSSRSDVFSLFRNEKLNLGRSPEQLSEDVLMDKNLR